MFPQHASWRSSSKKFEGGDSGYSALVGISGGKSEVDAEMDGAMGVINRGVWWLVTFEEVVKTLYMGLISECCKFCADGAQDCSVSSHDRAKAEVLP
jgi:hypothetical protein